MSATNEEKDESELSVLLGAHINFRRKINMTKQYGFYVEIYDNGVEVETLMTGDGKSQFTDIKYDDGTAGIGIAYGVGAGVGTTTEHNKLLDADMQIKWQVKFDNQKSVDAMIKALLDVKSHLAA